DRAWCRRWPAAHGLQFRALRGMAARRGPPSGLLEGALRAAFRRLPGLACLWRPARALAALWLRGAAPAVGASVSRRRMATWRADSGRHATWCRTAHARQFESAGGALGACATKCLEAAIS